MVARSAIRSEPRRAIRRTIPDRPCGFPRRRIEPDQDLENFLEAGLGEDSYHVASTVSLRTKKIKGLHENDFIMAAKIDRLVAVPLDGLTTDEALTMLPF